MLTAALSFAISLSISATTVNQADLSVVSALQGERALTELSTQSPKTIGLNEGDQLIHIKRIDLRHGFVLKAQRSHNGLPVIDQRLAARFDDSGKLVRVNSDFEPLNLDYTAPKITRKQAQLNAVAHRFGIKIPESIAEGKGPQTRLAVSPRYNTVVYAILLKGFFRDDEQVLLVDAVTGDVLEARSLAVRMEAEGTAFLPHPSPTGELGEPEAVTLTRLNEPAEGAPLVLEGEYVNASNCMTAPEDVRVLTCDDALPIFAGGMIPEGTSCSSPLVASFIPAEFKHIALGLCNTGHYAEATDGSFAAYEPIDRGASITTAPFAAFSEGFAEVQLYHHMNEATEWFHSLGHPNQGKPIDTMCNVSMPGQTLMSCGTDGMTAADATDHDTGVEVIRGCLEDIEANDQNGFSGFDNAFFMSGGSFADIFGYSDGGIFMGQGTNGDFTYDADVLYHELGHAIVAQVGSLQSGNLLDSTGTNSSPGALNEGYADYFSSAITGDPVVGGYIGNILTGGSGIRTMDHNQVCPEYWIGEVHADSHGWAAALWDARSLYPQTEVDEVTGYTVRIFDRVAYEALTMLTTNMLHDDAARETIEAVKNTPELEDPEGTLVTGAMEGRNVIACERIRPLTTNDPIEMMMFEGVGGGGMMGGGATYSPYAPPPLQFSIDVKAIAGQNPECVQFSAILGQQAASTGDAPDLLGGGSSGPIDWNVSLLWNADAPVEFTYAGSTVNTEQAGNEIPVTANVGAGLTTFTATFNFPEGADKLYLAMVNRTSDGGVIGNIRLTNVNTNCPEPEPEPQPEPEPETGTGEGVEGGEEEEKDGGCASTKPNALLFLLAGLGLMVLRRRLSN